MKYWIYNSQFIRRELHWNQTKKISNCRVCVCCSDTLTLLSPACIYGHLGPAASAKKQHKYTYFPGCVLKAALLLESFPPPYPSLYLRSTLTHRQTRPFIILQRRPSPNEAIWRTECFSSIMLAIASIRSH